MDRILKRLTWACAAFILFAYRIEALAPLPIARARILPA